MGQCGVNGPQSVLPTVNPDFTNPQNPLVQISLGYHLTCGVVQSGSVFCLGENTHAELSGLAGLDNNVHSTRVQVRDIDDAVSVGTGDFFACALRKSDGAGGGPSVFCWGDNTTAQLGTIEAGAQGTFNAQTIYTSYEPIKVPLP
jgi:alpha-tubulin suppressor-like RCC1 family protein